MQDDEQYIYDTDYQGSAQKHLFKLKTTMKISSKGEKRGTNKLEGQDLNTFVGPFQRMIEVVNGDSPQDSQSKNNRK